MIPGRGKLASMYIFWIFGLRGKKGSMTKRRAACLLIVFLNPIWRSNGFGTCHVNGPKVSSPFIYDLGSRLLIHGQPARLRINSQFMSTLNHSFKTWPGLTGSLRPNRSRIETEPSWKKNRKKKNPMWPGHPVATHWLLFCFFY